LYPAPRHHPFVGQRQGREALRDFDPAYAGKAAEKSTDPELKAVLASRVERWLKPAADLEHAQALRHERVQ
jgi:hypothetical protein